MHGKPQKGYISAELEAVFTEEDMVWAVMRKVPKGGPLHPIDAQINHVIAMVRAKTTRNPCTLL
jgi:transposase, IS5 family